MGRRLAILLVCLVLPDLAAAQQQKISRAHMEACLKWTLSGDHYWTSNSCDRPVSILFMTLDDGHVIEKDVAPGGRFDSGPIAPARPMEMMFTVCPVGYRPNLSFTAQNAEPISASLYNCLPLGRPIS